MVLISEVGGRVSRSTRGRSSAASELYKRQEYQRLMDHWHAVIPGKVLDVNYEDVVADLDTQVKRILDYCELPFEEACLRFHETDRAVKTASSEQVRKPIYASSVNLWKNYEPYIDELIEILDPLLQKLTADQQPLTNINSTQ